MSFFREVDPISHCPPFLNGQSIFFWKFLRSLGGSLFVVNTVDLEHHTVDYHRCMDMYGIYSIYVCLGEVTIPHMSISYLMNFWEQSSSSDGWVA